MLALQDLPVILDLRELRVEQEPQAIQVQLDLRVLETRGLLEVEAPGRLELEAQDLLDIQDLLELEAQGLLEMVAQDLLDIQDLLDQRVEQELQVMLALQDPQAQLALRELQV